MKKIFTFLSLVLIVSIGYGQSTGGGRPQSGTSSLPSFDPYNQLGVIPKITDANKFYFLGSALSTPAFAIHASGDGLITSVAGQNARAFLPLPREVNGSQYAVFTKNVDFDPSEIGASITYGLGDSTAYNITVANVGGNVVATMHDGTQFSSPLSGIQRFCLSFAVGNGYITSSVSLLGKPTLANTNVFRVPVWANTTLNKNKLNTEYLKTNATSSKISQSFNNPYSFDSDPTGQVLTESVIINSAGIPGEHDNIIVIPPRTAASLRNPVKPVHFFHGRTLTAFSFFGTTLADAGETARTLLNAGYPIIATTGGTGNTNTMADYWGAKIGVKRAHEVYETFKAHYKNVNKQHLTAWSMGGVCSLNYLREYPADVASIDMVCPAIDLEETGNASAIFTQFNAGLASAYSPTYMSLIASNLNNNPQTDNGTNWRVVGTPGDAAGVEYRMPTIATISAAISNNISAVLSTAVKPLAGDNLFFKISGQTRRVKYTTVGSIATTVVLDVAVTTPANEQVSLLRDWGSLGYDFAWQNYVSGAQTALSNWSSATSYALANFVRLASANLSTDLKPNNPARFTDFYKSIGTPIRLTYSGTPTGNDGILNNTQMTVFGTAVGATQIAGSGGHIAAGTLNAAAYLSYISNY